MKSMQICVCGWYYPQEFYRSLLHVSDCFDIVVVGNRKGDTLGLPFVVRKNTGLDWGAFSYFLDNLWDNDSSVLFLQDDNEVNEVFFNEVIKIPHDLAFVFRNKKEFRENYSHGRAFFASAKFLRILKQGGGIWYDKDNHGFIASGYSWTETPPKGSQDHNAGIRTFTNKVQEIGTTHPNLSVDKQYYSKNIYLGRRGKIVK
jgi:hypothetical protein